MGTMSNWRKAASSYANNNCVEAASWRKPRSSIGNGECTEVTCGHGVVGVRDSKDPMVVLEFPAAAWTTFTIALRG